MQYFQYQALSHDGRYKAGVWFGNSEEALYHHLCQKNLKLIRTKRRKFLFEKARTLPFTVLIDFCIYMKTLSVIKIPLTDSLELFSKQVRSLYAKGVFLTINQLLLEGFLLSQALSLYPKIFDPVFIQSVAIAENTGHLSKAFSVIRNHLEWQKDQSDRLNHILRYPLVLLCVSVLLMVFMATFVLPSLEESLSLLGNDQRSLWLHSFAVSAEFIHKNGIVILFAIVIFIICLKVFISFSQKIQKYVQQIMLRVPVWGMFRKRLLISVFLHNLSLLLDQNIDLLSSLRKSIEAIPNLFLRDRLLLMEEHITEGMPFSKALDESGCFSYSMVRLVQLGEESGNLVSLLGELSKFESALMMKRATSLLAWIQPFLIILMGLGLIWTVMAIVVPLYDSLKFFNE